jgi:hypothetical protein
MQSQRHALYKSQADAQAGERTRPQRHSQNTQIMRGQAAARQHAFDSRRQFNRVMIACLPHQFTHHLCAVIKGQAYHFCRRINR